MRVSAIEPALDLSANESALGPSPRAIEALARVAPRANHYPGSEVLSLRERLAREVGVSADMVALGVGSSGLLQQLVEWNVEPEDEVVVAAPSFPLYNRLVRYRGGRLVAVPGSPFAHDLDAMLAAIGPRTRMVIVCNPNNPTGTLVDAAAWRRFLDHVPGDVLVVSDEAYHEFVDDAEYPRTIDDLLDEFGLYTRRLVILRTFSKLYALAGLRVGYALASPMIASWLETSRVPFALSASSLAAAEAALDDRAHAERGRAMVRTGRAQLLAGLSALGLMGHPSHANFVFADLGRDAGPVCDALAERGILVRDVEDFGRGPSFVRITVGTGEQNEDFLHGLAAALGAPAAGLS